MFFITYEENQDKIIKIYTKNFNKTIKDLNLKKIIEVFQSNTLTTQDFLSSQYKISKEDMIEKLVE